MHRFILLASLFLLFLQPARATVLINEVMTSNGSTIADEDGGFEDWIELFNDGDHPVDLSGWGLSDSYGNPFKWAFPAGAMIEAGEHLLVWASGKNRAGMPPEAQPPVERLGGALNSTLAHRRYANFLPEGETGFAADFDPANTTNRAGWPITPVLPGETVLVSALVNTGGRDVRLSLSDGADMAGYHPFSVIINAATDTWIHLELTNTSADTILSYVVFVADPVPEGGTISVAGFTVARPVQPDPEWHTNFSLSASGEEVVLTMPDGTRVDEVPPTRLPRDVSLGRTPGHNDGWFYFDEPTPGSANETEAYLGIVDPPGFSHSAGFYTEPFQLQISHPQSDVTILYTLDGSSPQPGRLGGATYQYKNQFPMEVGDPFGPLLERTMQTLAYEGPLEVTDRSAEPYALAGINTTVHQEPVLPSQNIFKGTVVRAVATRPGYLSSPVATRSYYITPEGSGRYALPVVSISTDEDHLFGYENGILTAGAIYDRWRLDNPHAETPAWFVRPANYRERGDEWERNASVEIFETNSELVFSSSLGIRIHGGATRAFPRKSLRLYAREDLGAGEFQHELFPGLEAYDGSGRPVSSFRRLVLRNSGNDHASTLYRDALLQGLVSHWPIEAQAYRPVIQFINGEYWGINNLRECIDRFYIASHFNVHPDEVVILADNATLDTGFPSDRDQFLEVANFAKNEDLSLDANYRWVAERVDTDNLLQYFALQIYIANTDWPIGNIDFWRKRMAVNDPNAGPGLDGRWRWILFDTDFGFAPDRIEHDSFSHALGGGSSLHVPNLVKGLLQNQGFRNRFINAFCDLMNSSLRPEHVAAEVARFNAVLASSRSEHLQRWRTGSGTGGFMVTFANERPPVILQLLQQRYGTGSPVALCLDARIGEGRIKVNFTTIDHSTPGLSDPSNPYPWTGTYFRGVPVELEALPEPGHRLVGWVVTPTGAMVSAEEDDGPVFYSKDRLIPLELTEDTTVRAVFEPIPAAELPVALHVWDFQNAGALLTPSATIGGGMLQIEPGQATQILANTGSDFPTQHLRVNNPSEAVVTFALPTTGYESIRLDYLTRRSGQGVERHVVSYSLDGSVWTTFGDYLVADAPPQARSFDFSGVEGAENNPLFAVRVAMLRSDAQINAGTGLEGNNRFDDVVLSGVALPGVKPPPVVNVEAVPSNLPLRGGGATPLDLSGWFTDPSGAPLVFAGQSLNPDVLQASSAPGGLVLTPLKAGEAVLQMAAHDGVNAPVGVEIRVLVYPEAFALADGDFSFSTWSSSEPAGSYPDHMIFLQSEVNDPALTTELGRAYQIPLADAAVAMDAEFPYSATSRTRINGLGEDGIAFINTGRGRDVGAALVALDTTDVEEAFVTFTAGTVVPNVRIYAMRLQYRTGSEGAFTDVTDAEGQPVEYVRNATSGHTFDIGPVALPPEAMGHPCVQLLWRYHFVSGGSGARPQLRLDNITVRAADNPRKVWLRENGLPADGSGDGADFADPDGDGIPNIMERALAMDPRSADGSAPVDSSIEGDTAWLQFRVSRDIADLEVTVETSSGLDAWQPVALEYWQLVEDADPVFQVWRVALPNASDRGFGRVRVAARE